MSMTLTMILACTLVVRFTASDFLDRENRATRSVRDTRGTTRRFTSSVNLQAIVCLFNECPGGEATVTFVRKQMMT